MTRSYEALIILKSIGTDAELAQAVAQVEEPIKKFGGRIEHSENMGRRRLAYRIGRQQEGYYQLVRFQLAPEQLEGLKRLLRLNETIMRYLILSREDGQPAAAPAVAEAKASA